MIIVDANNLILDNRRRNAYTPSARTSFFLELETNIIMSMSFQYDKEASDRILYVPYIRYGSQRTRLLQALSPHRGDRVLDVGSGPGFLASALNETVGESGSVCAVLISASCFYQ